MQDQKAKPCNCDPFSRCVKEVHGSESALLFTHNALSKACLWQWRKPPCRLSGFLPVATLSPPLKSEEEVRERKNLSCHHSLHQCPASTPLLPSTQTSSSVLRNVKKRGHRDIQRGIKEDKRGKEGKDDLLRLSFPSAHCIVVFSGGEDHCSERAYSI